MNINDEEDLGQIGCLLERLHQAGYGVGGNITLVYVAKGAQHVGTIQNQNVWQVAARAPEAGDAKEPRIRRCLSRLMAERYGDGLLFSQQSHWQAVYRILVDRGYCRDSDFEAFDDFIRRVMPDKVNRPYTKSSVKQISQTDFCRPFSEWRYDPETSKTRKPFDRMAVIARRFLDILEENGL